MGKRKKLGKRIIILAIVFFISQQTVVFGADFDADVLEIFLTDVGNNPISIVNQQDTIKIKSRIKNLSSWTNGYWGEATFDIYFKLTRPDGSTAVSYWWNDQVFGYLEIWQYSYTRQHSQWGTYTAKFEVWDKWRSARFDFMTYSYSVTPLPPITPSLSAPSTATSGSNYAVSWSASIYHNRYLLQESLSSSFTSPNNYILSASTTSKTFNHTVGTDTRYYYRVAADNSDTGKTSSWSNTGSTLVRAKRRLIVSSAYGSPNPSVGSSYYNYGTSITASVSSPVSGGTGVQYVCTGWNGTGSVASSGTGTSTNFTITSDSTITWNWKTQYTLSTSVSPSGSGTVSKSPNKSWYDNGDSVQLTASPNSGYGFSNWSGNLTGSLNPASITMNGAKSVTANFNVISYLISGYVRDSGSNGISGVTITFSGGLGTTTTDASGFYSKTATNGNYTITPSKSGYTFNPTSKNVTVSGSDVGNQNFTGTENSYAISGYIKDSGSNGISGVTVSFTGGHGSITTDANGLYSQTGFTDGNYTVTPSKIGYGFNPSSRNVTISGGDVNNQDFTGSENSYTISGYVRDSGSNGISGVTISFSGGHGSITTDANGLYSKPGFTDGNYTVTPSKTGYTFIPTSLNVTVSGSDVNNQNFEGTGSGVNKADLIIESITPSVSVPTSGQVFSVDVVVKNQGTEIASGFYLHVWYNRASAPTDDTGSNDSEYVSSLSVGASTTVTFYSVSYVNEGTFDFWAFADASADVPESDETNNILSKSIAVSDTPIPDLVIESITPLVLNPIEGELFDVEVVVKNEGSGDAGSFYVDIWMDRASAPTDNTGSFDYQEVSSLTVGATTTLVFYDVSYSLEGAYTFWALADSTDSIAELIESNNARSESITVSKKPKKKGRCSFTDLDENSSMKDYFGWMLPLIIIISFLLIRRKPA